MTDALARLIFVGGAPRSGTTLLQNMLGSHPEIVGAPEFLHLPDIVRLRNKLQESVDAGLLGSSFPPQSIDVLVRDMIAAFLLPLADRMGRRYLSEKTPENVLVFPELTRLFPGNRFFHIVRDPRAIVASILEVGKRARTRNMRPPAFTSNISAACSHAKACILSGLRASRMAPERVSTVLYEKLVESPAVETRRICEFLGLPWAKAMLQPGARSHLGEEVMTKKTNEIWYDRESFARNPVTDSVAKWKTQLTTAEQRHIAGCFADVEELAEWGYDLSSSDPAGAGADPPAAPSGLATPSRRPGNDR